jgi:hypothetical protein
VFGVIVALHMLGFAPFEFLWLNDDMSSSDHFAEIKDYFSLKLHLFHAC